MQHKLEMIIDFVKDNLNEFKNQSKDDPENILAAFGFEIYKEISKEINNY